MHRTPISRALIGSVLLMSLFFARPARAVDHLDPLDQDLPTDCHAPVPVTIDPDWRESIASYRDSSLRALSRHLGDHQRARIEVLRAIDLAERTRLHAFHVLSTTRELVLRGFRGPEMDAARLAILDLWSVRGAAPAERLLRALGTIKDQGALGPAEAQTLGEHVPEEILVAVLADRLGLRGPAGLDQVRLRLRSRQRDSAQRSGAPFIDSAQRSGAPFIDAQTGIAAAIEGVRRQLPETTLGQAAQQGLSACVATMRRSSCSQSAAEQTCRATPREHLQILRQL